MRGRKLHIMTKQHHYIQSTDDTQRLHYITWTPDGEPIGVLQLVHGMEEYIDRYDTMARSLCDSGWAVIGHDHLGHGESGRWERGFFTEKENGHDVVIADMHVINGIAHRLWKDRKVFIFGHSMGSFFTRRYLAEYGSSVSGAVICGSGWYPPIATGTAYYVARLIGGIVGMHKRSGLLRAICSAPFLFAFRSEGKNAWLSRNKENVSRYNADPLCGFGFTCGGYRDMYRNLLLVSKQHGYSRLMDMPVLVIAGAEDPVGGKDSVRKIAEEYRSLGFSNVTERVIPLDRHEILLETDANDTIDYIAGWLISMRNVVPTPTSDCLTNILP